MWSEYLLPPFGSCHVTPTCQIQGGQNEIVTSFLQCLCLTFPSRSHTVSQPSNFMFGAAAKGVCVFSTHTWNKWMKLMMVTRSIMTPKGGKKTKFVRASRMKYKDKFPALSYHRWLCLQRNSGHSSCWWTWSRGPGPERHEHWMCGACTWRSRSSAGWTCRDNILVWYHFIMNL